MTLTPPSSTTLNAVARLLGEARGLGFSNWSLRVRTVAFAHAGKWHHFATVATVGEGLIEFERIARPRGSVALIDWSFPIEGEQDAQDLSAYLTHWQDIVKAVPRVTFQNGVQLTRTYSDYRKSSWPAWWSRLNPAQSQIAQPVPEGPFFDSQSRLFGESIQKLAVQFLEEARHANHHNAPDEYLLRIPDARVRICKLDEVENSLRVKVENPYKLKLYCGVVGSSLGGEMFHQVFDFEKDEISVALPFVVANLEIWVILKDGYALDYYEETPRRSSWGLESSLFNLRRRTLQHPIGQVLEGGENDSVEFKPFVLLKPGIDKAMEILKTLSAFANSGGGSIYFGISDTAEPVGMDRELRHAYRGERDLSNCQIAYERDMRKLVSEGIAPTLPVEFHWHDFAHRSILQVRVPPSPSIASLLVSGDSYRRAGATNRRARFDDVSRPVADGDPIFESFKGGGKSSF